MVDQLRSLLAKGGFHLTKWISNSREVIESVPESDGARSVKELDLDSLPIERALGIQWDVQSDVSSASKLRSRIDLLLGEAYFLSCLLSMTPWVSWRQ